MRKLSRVAYISLSLAAVSFAAAVGGCGRETARAERPPVVRVAIQPNYSLTIMSRRYRPLIQYLSAETGYEVEQVSSLGQSNYLSSIEGARADCAFLNPLLYLQLGKTKGAYPLVRVINEDGTDRYRGVIIVRSESAIESIQDLRGSIAMTSSRKGVAGYIGQYKLLRDNGIDPDRDLAVVIGGTQDEVVRAVIEGKAKAGFVREDALATAGAEQDARELRIIAYTDYFPTWCFAAFGNTDPAAAAAIKNALLRLDPKDRTHHAILTQAGAAGFIEASDADYDSFRKTVADLGLPY